MVKSFIDYTKIIRTRTTGNLTSLKYSFTLFLYLYCFVGINTNKHEDGHITLENGYVNNFHVIGIQRNLFSPRENDIVTDGNAQMELI